MRTVVSVRGAIAGAVILLAGCSSDGGSSNARLEGSYQGTLFVGGAPAAPFTLNATQTGSSVSGTFTSGSRRGTFAANVNGSQFAAVLSGGGLQCNASGTYDDDSLSGALACAGGANGSFSANRV
jgi:hypothetical protein